MGPYAIDTDEQNIEQDCINTIKPAIEARSPMQAGVHLVPCAQANSASYPQRDGKCYGVKA